MTNPSLETHVLKDEPLSAYVTYKEIINMKINMRMFSTCW